ncbi:MAG: pyrimidine utilization protein D [Pseudomonadota bacterium]
MPVADGLWYDWAGNPDGEVLVLSAGLGGSASYWQPNLAVLGADHRLLLYDHRGTGRSDRRLPDAVTVADLANDILTLLDATGIERMHLVGHAAGAVAGLALALKAPERLGKLVAVNGWAAPDPHFARCFDARLALLRRSGPEAYLRAQPIFLFPAPWISEHHEALEAEFAHQLAGFAGADSFEKRIAALRGFDIADRLGEIATPVLALASHDDMLMPWTASERLVAGLPNATLAVMPWGGHACNVTDPDSFHTLILEFLRS